jgi:hypothetical protein
MQQDAQEVWSFPGPVQPQTVFTTGVSGGSALDKAFPLRKAA